METTRFLNGIVKYMTFIDISNACCLYCIKLLGSQHKLDSEVSYLLSCGFTLLLLLFSSQMLVVYIALKAN
jgi:hypothetical protein